MSCRVAWLWYRIALFFEVEEYTWVDSNFMMNVMYTILLKGKMKRCSDTEIRRELRRSRLEVEDLYFLVFLEDNCNEKQETVIVINADIVINGYRFSWLGEHDELEVRKFIVGPTRKLFILYFRLRYSQVEVYEIVSL